MGDEGGFAPNILDNKEGLDLLNTAIEKAGYSGKVRYEREEKKTTKREKSKFMSRFINGGEDLIAELLLLLLRIIERNLYSFLWNRIFS